MGGGGSGCRRGWRWRADRRGGSRWRRGGCRRGGGGALPQGREEVVESGGGAGEGGVREVLAAGGAAAGAGEEGGGAVAGCAAGGFLGEYGEEDFQRGAVVGEGGAGAGDGGGVAAAAGRGVRVEAVLGAVAGEGGRVEEAEGGVHALLGEGAQQGLQLLEVATVVVEGEGAVAAHGGEVPGVGEDGGGAGEFAAERVGGVVVGGSGGCHGSPSVCAGRADGSASLAGRRLSPRVIGGSDNGGWPAPGRGAAGAGLAALTWRGTWRGRRRSARRSGGVRGCRRSRG